MAGRIKGSRRIGGFLLQRQLAQSSSSTIYLATPERGRGIGGNVVVKVVRETAARRGSELLRRFEEEVRVTRAVDHPNVVRVLAHGVDRGLPYMVLEHLEGASLARVMEACASGDTLPAAFWAHLCARAADGLHAIHEPNGTETGLVHNDVSPQNIFVTIDGRVKVLDLGLVREAGPPPSIELEGELAGTYPYLAPERVARRHADRRADLFSLGVVLYEAVTLTRLFKDSTDERTLANIGRHRITPPHHLAPDLPRRLEAIVMQCLRQAPEGRYATATDLAVALDRFVASEEAGAWDREELVGALSERLMSMIDTSVD